MIKLKEKTYGFDISIINSNRGYIAGSYVIAFNKIPTVNDILTYMYDNFDQFFNSGDVNKKDVSICKQSLFNFSCMVISRSGSNKLWLTASNIHEIN